MNQQSDSDSVASFQQTGRRCGSFIVVEPGNYSGAKHPSLDPFYKTRPERKRLVELKKTTL